MSSTSPLRCSNCGTLLDPPAPGATSVICPVCQLETVLSAPAATPPLSSDELEARLGALVNEARTGGLSPDTIVRVLQDELEFAAELTHVGRQICVQIIDLGPQEARTLAHTRDHAPALHSRAVGSA